MKTKKVKPLAGQGGRRMAMMKKWTMGLRGIRGVLGLGLLWLVAACGPLTLPVSGGGMPAASGATEWVSRDWPSGGRYEGELLNGKRHGKGTFTWPDGASYTGDYRQDERTGAGVFTWPNGSRYEGQFVAGKRHGKGTFIWPDGARYVGEYQNGQRHGQGTFFSADKTVVVCQTVPQEESQEWMDGRLLGSSVVPKPSLPLPGAGVAGAASPGVGGVSAPVSPATRDVGRSAFRSGASASGFSAPPDFDVAPARSAATSGSGIEEYAPVTAATTAGAGIARERGRSGSAATVGVDAGGGGPPATGGTWREPRTGMTFVRVPGGCYRMGSTHSGGEGVGRTVCVDEFWFGRYEVTRSEWEGIMGSVQREGPVPVVDRQQSRHDPREPIDNVSWNDVQQYIARLGQATGARFRLPTEAEWEYACRSGGRDQLYCGGDQADDLAWVDHNSQGRVHSVGSKAPNALGLYDMSGNVWEWVADWYAPELTAPDRARNPIGPEQGDGRVLRGGSWLSGAQYARATQRYHFPPDRRYNLLGFRLVRLP
ncbi:MAG: SUMF1/EgtB/PvdO family nonheme iron enzyme [Magnetococcales bacterium]|nr:SUMF1/EgtB/PvdO family nonheme iron enzyme [Magnetococcales bacterium]